MKFKKFITEEGVTDCRNLRRDTEQCQTGCKKKNISKGSQCPFTDEDDYKCPCYRSR